MKIPVVLATLLMAAALGSAMAQAPTIRVGPNILVSGANRNAVHLEMFLAADPKRPERLLACSIIWPDESHTHETVTYASVDGARTWAEALRTRGDKQHQSWDPDCFFGQDGTAYEISENVDSAGKSFERLDRSLDGGKTWETVSRFKHGERTDVAVDRSGGPRDGALYFWGMGTTCVTGACASQSPNALFLRASTDGGRTLSTQWIPNSPGGYTPNPGTGAVLSDGSVLAVFGEWRGYYRPDGSSGAPPFFRDGAGRITPNADVKVFRAVPAAANWPMDVEVFKVSDWAMAFGQWNGSYLPRLTADQTTGPFRDRVYVTWEDLRSGRSEVYFAYSTDKGKTWSSSRVINEDRARFNAQNVVNGPDDIHGTVVVNRDGVVGVAWLDRSDHPDNASWTVRFRASLDGGETFLPSVKVSDVPYDPARNEPLKFPDARNTLISRSQPTDFSVHPFYFSAGHTTGMAADASGRFHVLWVNNVTGVPQLWTSFVTVSGTAQKNGGATLATLVNVDDKIDLRYTRRQYTRANELLETDLYLENVSKDTIRAPLKVRVLDIRSDYGVARVVNADEGGDAEGAVWDFTSMVPSGVLPPGQRTPAKHLRIKVSGVVGPYATSMPAGLRKIVGFNTRALAGSVAPSTTSASRVK